MRSTTSPTLGPSRCSLWFSISQWIQLLLLSPPPLLKFWSWSYENIIIRAQFWVIAWNWFGVFDGFELKFPQCVNWLGHWGLVLMEMVSNWVHRWDRERERRESTGENKGMGWREGDLFLEINDYFCFSIILFPKFFFPCILTLHQAEGGGGRS